MAKYYGKVGYATSGEKTVIIDGVSTPTGVWVDTIVERYYTGDAYKCNTRWQTGTGLNDDLRASNQISIVADGFAYQSFSKIKYIEWMGVLWKVTDASVERPRIILTLGGEWNGPTAPVTPET